MTLAKYIYELKMIIRRLKLSDDDDLDDRLVADWIHNQRHLWIRNEINKNHSIDDQIIQDLGAIKLEIADRSISPSFTTGYHVLRTNVEIPKTIEFYHSDGLISVGPIDDLALPFSYVSMNRARVSGNGEFNKNIIFAFRYANRIYLITKADRNFARYIRYVNAKGVFADPTAVESFKHIDDTACYNTLTDSYPLNGWMWEYMKEAIKQANYKELIVTPVDKENDATSELKQDGQT